MELEVRCWVLVTIRRNVLYGGILHSFQLPIFKQCLFVKEMLLENTFHSVGTLWDHFLLPEWDNIAFV